MKQKLTETISALRAEIAQLHTDDAESKQRLEQLVENLENKLEHPDDDDHHLDEGIKDSITHFEVTHPRITAILNDIMMTLSNMGI
jgi:predicted  nucleic acid-binding Zn-ribbon protein